MKILVTGASGMVGRHAIQMLQNQNIPFVASSRTRPNDLSKDMEWESFDLRTNYTSYELIQKFPDIDAIFHIGALVPSQKHQVTDIELFDTNVRSCIPLAQWALEREISFIYLSGAIVYNKPFEKNIREDAQASDTSMGGFYGYSKLLAEKILDYYVKHGLNLTILRASSIYGLGLSEEKLIMKHMALASNNETIYLRPPISESVNLIHAADVVSAMINALNNKVRGIYNLAYTREYSVLEIAQACIRLYQKGKIEISPSNISETQNSKFCLDIAKAKEAFNFAPKIDLNTGLEYICNNAFGI